MAVNLDADIVNADWTKYRSNDLPPITRREQLDALIRDIPHWLRDLPSANPDAVHSVWHLLTGPEQSIYSERVAREHKLGLPTLRSNGSVVLSSREPESRNGSNQDFGAVAAAVRSAFEVASSHFDDDDDTTAIERKLVGLTDQLLDGLKSEYLPAVETLVERATQEAEHALEVARSRAASDFRTAAPRKSTPSTTARRYALSRALRLVDDLSTTARKAARDILSRDDLQLSTRVRRLRAVIGLSERQHDGYMRHLGELSSTSQRIVDLGDFGIVEVPVGGLEQRSLQQVADRYAAYLVNQRSALIAVTEGVSIREETRRATWERLEPGARFSWVTIGESCPQCASLDGVQVRAGEDYDTDIHTPPAHPGCDCTQAVQL